MKGELEPFISLLSYKIIEGYRTKSVDNELLQGDTIRQQVQPFCQDFLFWFKRNFSLYEGQKAEKVNQNQDNAVEG